MHNRELEILLKVPLNLRGEYLAESCIVKLVDGEGVQMPGEPQWDLSASVGDNMLHLLSRDMRIVMKIFSRYDVRDK